MVVTQTRESLAAEFAPRVLQIGRLLPMLAPWDNPMYVKRAWCLFELFTAIQHHNEVDITIVLPPAERKGFESAMEGAGYSSLDAVLSGIDSAAAEASVTADLEAIRQHIKDLPGGFDALDAEVQLHLQGWFAEQGAVMSASRVMFSKSKSYSAGRLRPEHSAPRLSKLVQKAAVHEFAEGTGLEDKDDTGYLVVEALEPGPTMGQGATQCLEVRVSELDELQATTEGDIDETSL